MGRTNRILSKLCYATAISFKTTQFAKINSYFTGIPVRPFKKEKVKKNKKKFLLLEEVKEPKYFLKLYPKYFYKYPKILKKK